MLSRALALAGSLPIAACSAIPNAVVAVPKSPEKPLYQVDRLEQVQGGALRWAFVNDQSRGTEVSFRFATVSPLESRFTMVCVTVNEKTLARTKAKTTVRPLPRAAQATAAQAPAPDQENGPRFSLPAATGAGPAVCVADLKVQENAKPDSYSYSIYQDNVLKQDPVIVIRTK
jgi:hypothetical protein